MGHSRNLFDISFSDFAEITGALDKVKVTEGILEANDLVERNSKAPYVGSFIVSRDKYLLGWIVYFGSYLGLEHSFIITPGTPEIYQNVFLILSVTNNIRRFYIPVTNTFLMELFQSLHSLCNKLDYFFMRHFRLEFDPLVCHLP